MKYLIITLIIIILIGCTGGNVMANGISGGFGGGGRAGGVLGGMLGGTGVRGSFGIKGNVIPGGTQPLSNTQVLPTYKAGWPGGQDYSSPGTPPYGLGFWYQEALRQQRQYDPNAGYNPYQSQQVSYPWLGIQNQSANLPQFFTQPNVSLGNLSPMALYTLQNLFPDYQPVSTVKPLGMDLGQSRGWSEQFKPYAYDPEAKETVYTEWVKPELMSAQAGRQLEEAGAYQHLMAYLGLMDDARKQSWIEQSMAGMPSSEKGRQTQWVIPRQM